MKLIPTLLTAVCVVLSISLSAQINNKQLEPGTKARQIPMSYDHPSGLFIRHFVDFDTLITQRVQDSLADLRAFIIANGGSGGSGTAGADWNTNLSNIPVGFADGIDDVDDADNDPSNEIQDLTPYQTIAGTANFDKDSTDNLTTFSTVNNSTGIQLSLLSDDASASTTLFLDGGDEFDITRETQAGLDGGRVKFRADTVDVLATKHDLIGLGSGTNIWNENANGIDNDKQNVGINDDTPTAPLIVKDTIGSPAGSTIAYIGDKNNTEGVIVKRATSTNPEVMQVFGPMKLLNGTEGSAGIIGDRVNIRPDTVQLNTVLLDSDGDLGTTGQKLVAKVGGTLEWVDDIDYLTSLVKIGNVLEYTDESGVLSPIDISSGSPFKKLDDTETESLTDAIHHTGNVGIGTTANLHALNVAGRLYLENSGGVVIRNNGLNITLGNLANNTESGVIVHSIGVEAGETNTGNNNIFHGYKAGENNGNKSSNMYFGHYSANKLLGSNNNVNGFRALENITLGNNNAITGFNSFRGNGTSTDASQNTAFGSQIAIAFQNGNNNTAFGYAAFNNLQTGENNTAVGVQSGYLNVGGSNNVYLGYRAGYNDTDSDNLVIGNSLSPSTPLIRGHFVNKTLNVNGQFRLNQYTATEAGALTNVTDATMIYVSDTDATFSDIGFWGRENGSWEYISSGASSSIFTADGIIPAGIRNASVEGDLRMYVGSLSSSAGLAINNETQIGGEGFSALTTNTSSSSANGFYAIDNTGLRIKTGEEDEGRTIYSANTSGDFVWGQADNIGRITTTPGLWSDERQVHLAISSIYPSASTIAFPPASWTAANQHDGDILTLINKTGNTQTLSGPIEGSTTSTFDVLDGETARLVYYSGGDYWISIR